MAEFMPLAVEHHLAETKLRKRRGWRLLWLVIVGFGLLILSVLVMIYFAYAARGRRLLRDEIAAIQADGGPLTTAELTAWQSQPLGERDITINWQAALAPFTEDEFHPVLLQFPRVNNYSRCSEALAMESDWPAAQVEQFLDKYRAELDSLRLAAREEGAVRMPRNFAFANVHMPPEIFFVQNATRALSLSFQQHLRAGRVSAAIDDLHAQLALGEVLHRDPLFVSFYTRTTALSIALANMRLLSQSYALSDTQLAELQQALRRLDIQQQFLDSARGERALMYQTFHISLADHLHDASPAMANELATTTDIARVSRPEDCALALQFMTRYVELTKLKHSAAIPLAEQLEGEKRALHDHFNRWRYTQTLLVLPSIQGPIYAAARFIAARNMTDCVLAMRRYELKHGQLPKSLDVLVPDFLPQAPLDPYSDQPLRLKTAPEVLLYGLGPNGIDDNGVMDDSGFEPDVVLPYKPLARGE